MRLPSLVVAALVGPLATATIGAQPAPHGVVSAVTGVQLPAGATATGGLVTRMATRAAMHLDAKSQGAKVGDRLELYRLAPTGDGWQRELLAAIAGQGFTVTPFPSGTDVWAWLDKGAQRYMAYCWGTNSDPWVAFANVETSGVPAGVVAPASAAPTSATPASVTSSPAPPLATDALSPSATASAPLVPASSPAPTSWAYTTVTVADGWQAVDRGDWVEARKGRITVRAHYRRFDLRSFVNQDGNAYVWQQLIAPRYRDITDYWLRRPFWDDYANGEFVSATATEIATGQRVFVALYRTGNSWSEWLAPDKATFEREVTVVREGSGTNWTPMRTGGGINRFPVALSDLVGTWESASTGGVQYVSTVTGNSMGMGAVSNVETWTFAADGRYTSRYVGAGGMVGTQRFGGEAYTGQVTVSEWTLTATNRMKGATDQYSVWLEGVPGGRLLHMVRNDFELVLQRRP